MTLRIIFTALALVSIITQGIAMTEDEYAAMTSFYYADNTQSYPEIYPDSYPMEYPPNLSGESFDDHPPASETAFFSKEKPYEYGTLVDGGPVSREDGNRILSQVPWGSGLWIADGMGKERRLNLRVPIESWANQEIITDRQGDLVIYYRYPSGEVRSYNMGYVYPYHKYWTWFYNEIPGVYEIWYTIGGRYESNHIWFDVWEDWPWWYGGYSYTSYYGPGHKVHDKLHEPVVYPPVVYDNWVYEPAFYDAVVYDPIFYEPMIYAPITYNSMSVSISSRMSTSMTFSGSSKTSISKHEPVHKHRSTDMKD